MIGCRHVNCSRATCRVHVDQLTLSLFDNSTSELIGPGNPSLTIVASEFLPDEQSVQLEPCPLARISDLRASGHALDYKSTPISSDVKEAQKRGSFEKCFRAFSAREAETK